MAVALPDFAYRAEMDNRIVEHELCPVVVATVDPSVALRLTPDEVEAAEWTTWGRCASVPREAPHTLSPWAVEQVRELDRLGAPCKWLERGDTGRALDEIPGAPAREALTLGASQRSDRAGARAGRASCSTSSSRRGPQSSRPWTPRSHR